MSQSRFMTKQFASLDIYQGNITINEIPLGTSGINILTDGSASDWAVIEPLVSDANSYIGITNGNEGGIFVGNFGSNYPVGVYFTVANIFLSNFKVEPINSYNQSTNFTTGITIDNTPSFIIITQVPNITTGTSKTFTITSNTVYVSNPFQNALIQATINDFTEGIPHVSINNRTNTSFDVVVSNLGSVEITSSLSIGFSITNNANNFPFGL